MKTYEVIMSKKILAKSGRAAKEQFLLLILEMVLMSVTKTASKK